MTAQEIRLIKRIALAVQDASRSRDVHLHRDGWDGALDFVSCEILARAAIEAMRKEMVPS